MLAGDWRERVLRTQRTENYILDFFFLSSKMKCGEFFISPDFYEATVFQFGRILNQGDFKRSSFSQARNKKQSMASQLLFHHL